MVNDYAHASSRDTIDSGLGISDRVVISYLTTNSIARTNEFVHEESYQREYRLEIIKVSMY